MDGFKMVIDKKESLGELNKLYKLDDVCNEY